MPILDRYILGLFVRVLLICFCSFAGLYVVIDAFGNLEELLSYSDRAGGLLPLIASYYGARVLTFFDRTSGLLALTAAVFTVTWLERNNELTAIMAGGVSKWRVIRPLAIAAIVVTLLSAANREAVIPQFREVLAHNIQDPEGTAAQRLRPRFDHQSDIFLGGSSLDLEGGRIVAPRFRLPRDMRRFGRQIVAEEAVWTEATPDHPRGYLFRGVTEPAAPAELAAVRAKPPAGAEIILTPKETRWLDGDQLFVVSDVTLEHLSAASGWKLFSSTPTLVAALRNPSLDFGNDVRVTLHTRLVQPLLDLTLFFLALPMVLLRRRRNLFVAAGMCLAVVIGFSLVVVACHGLGANYLLSPTLAAWGPVLLFAPAAAALTLPLRE